MEEIHFEMKLTLLCFDAFMLFHVDPQQSLETRNNNSYEKYDVRKYDVCNKGKIMKIFNSFWN